jgi:DNA repair ATPase RecN
MIKSGFANTVDEASIVYWTLQNAGGMNDEDLAKFVKQMRDLHATVMDIDGAQAQSHTIDVPYEAREKLLDRLNKDMYRDAMALDTENIAAGATTATQIRAAYENLNTKCDKLEYQVIDWLNGIMAVAGIKDEPTFTRSQIINQTEMVEVIIQAAPYLSDDYVTKKILEILGDGDKAEEMLEDIDEDDMGRITTGDDPDAEPPIEE